MAMNLDGLHTAKQILITLKDLEANIDSVAKKTQEIERTLRSLSNGETNKILASLSAENHSIKQELKDLKTHANDMQTQINTLEATTNEQAKELSRLVKLTHDLQKKQENTITHKILRVLALLMEQIKEAYDYLNPKENDKR